MARSLATSPPKLKSKGTPLRRESLEPRAYSLCRPCSKVVYRRGKRTGEEFIAVTSVLTSCSPSKVFMMVGNWAGTCIWGLYLRACEDYSSLGAIGERLRGSRSAIWTRHRTLLLQHGEDTFTSILSGCCGDFTILSALGKFCRVKCLSQGSSISTWEKRSHLVLFPTVMP